jgi:hypothetical protein
MLKIWNCGLTRQLFCEVTLSRTETNRGPGFMVSTDVFDQDPRIEIEDTAFFLALDQASAEFDRRVAALVALGKRGQSGEAAMSHRRNVWSVTAADLRSRPF